MNRFRRNISLATAAIIATALLYGGFWRVPQGHRGVVFRFGAIRPEPLHPGLHLVPPWPVGQVLMIPVEQIRQIHVKETIENSGDSQASEFLTGDENLLQAAIQVDYRVTDPLEIARAGLAGTELRLTSLAESALVATLARKPVAEVLGPGREMIGQELRKMVQDLADRQALGVEAVAVIWSEVIPPREVQPDFEATQVAVNEAAKAVADAATTAQREQIKTGSEAVGIVAEAEIQASALKAAALTETVRFKALLQQARRTGFMPTAKQLWLNTIAELLPSFRGRTLLATDQAVDLTIIRQKEDQPKRP